MRQFLERHTTCGVSSALVVVVLGCGAVTVRDDDPTPKLSTADSSSTATGSGGASVTSSSGSGGESNAFGPCPQTDPCVLAADQQIPWGIGSDGAYVYWVDGSTSPNGQLLPDGAIRKCEAGSCASPTVLASGQLVPVHLALSQGRVVWTNTGNNGYGTDGAVMSCSSAGCGQAPTMVAGGIAPSALTVDGTYAYWITLGNGMGWIWRCVIDACAPELVFEDTGMPNDVAISGSTIVWTAWGTTSGGTVKTCDPDACTPTQLVAAPDTPYSVAVAGGTVYYATFDAVMTCPLTGCNGAPNALLNGLAQPADVVTDGTHVYVTLTPMGSGGSVLQCSVRGCNNQPTTIASGPAIMTPYFAAVDRTNVYWTDASAGTVMMATKRRPQE